MSLTGTAEGVSAKEKLIVALDVATAGEARRLFDALRDSAGMFKVATIVGGRNCPLVSDTRKRPITCCLFCFDS